MAESSQLHQPIRIGPLELGNRFVMPALTTFYDIEGGRRFIDFYLERVKGGTGLIIIGSLQALYPGRAGKSGWVPDESVLEKGMLKINHDLYIPRLRQITDEIHQAGGRVAVQLGVYGFWAKGGYGAPAEEVSPSGVELKGEQFRPGLEHLSFIKGGRVLEAEEIPLISEEIADAAVRGKSAGFDAIELQALGGNLISRFLSPVTNKRADQYGGPLENRARFLLETIAAIKRKVGEDFPLICRINGDDLIPGGMTLPDYQALTPLLEDAGVHALDLMAGWYETRKPVNQMCVPRGAFVHLAEGLKEVVDIPVIANIRINDAKLAEEIVDRGRADMVAMCSPLIADPELPVKARESRYEDIRMCTACCNCWSMLAEHFQPIDCAVNARAGREAQTPIVPAESPKTVVVLGGGPAGMEAARVASLRGHRVELHEKGERLGGQVNYAALPPFKDELHTVPAYLETQIRKQGVAVHVNSQPSIGSLRGSRPDHIIVATGAKPLIPDNIPGCQNRHVMTVIDVLTGTQETGEKAVIVGGGCSSCETAEFLARKGKQVTIVEMLERIANDVDLWNRWVLLDRLDELGVGQVCGARAVKIDDRGIHLEKCRDQEPFYLEADSIVLALGCHCDVDTRLYQEICNEFEHVHLIGDARQPRRIKEAIREGFDLGSTL